MKNKKLTILLILSLFLMGISMTSLGSAAKSSGVRPLEEIALMDLTHENFVERELAFREGESVVSAKGSSIVAPVSIGEDFVFTVSDDGLGVSYNETFVVVLDGVHGIILITQDAVDSFDGVNYHFANPIGDDSEPWLRSEDLISAAQLAYLLDEFDNNMYESVTDVFGEPLARGDEGQKVWTLIFNIRDDAYYNPAAESYIAGYFSASESAENDMNIMHIDTYAWAARTGPDADRPFLYEGVFAHEFEHLVHFDQDQDEPSWVDEACAELAMFLCGYGHPAGQIANYMVNHMFVSFTFWGGALEDYGAAYLMALYYFEHYGGADFFRNLVQDPANGIEGIENTLAEEGYPGMTFAEIFDDLTIAIYLDDPTPGSLHGFDTLDVGTIDSWGYSVEYALEMMYGITPFGSSDWPLPFDLMSSWFLGAPQPYTAHYYRFGGSGPLNAALDGDELAGPGPYSGNYAWFSDVNAWAWRAIHQTFHIPLGGAALKFMTFFEIEEYWDFAYVEVHDLTTGNWTTLADINNYTITVDPFEQDNPNVPDGREPKDYQAKGEWNAFTEYSIYYDTDSDGWIPIEMDLTPFAGHDIEIFITTWQDGAFTYQMMYVDDIEITNGVLPLDDVETGTGGWSARPDYDGGSSWVISECFEQNNWQATLIETLWQPTERYSTKKNTKATKLLSETQMEMDFATQSGAIFDITSTPLQSRRTQVLIVSNRADHILPADYWFGFW